MTIYRTRYRESSLRGSTNGRQRTRSPSCRGSVEKRFAAKKAKIDMEHSRGSGRHVVRAVLVYLQSAPRTDFSNRMSARRCFVV